MDTTDLAHLSSFGEGAYLPLRALDSYRVKVLRATPTVAKLLNIGLKGMEVILTVVLG